MESIITLRQTKDEARTLCAIALHGAQPALVTTDDYGFWSAFRAEMRYGAHPDEFAYLLRGYDAAVDALERAMRGTRYGGLSGEFV